MSERDFRLYLADIIESGSAIQEYIQGCSFQDFSCDRKTYSAVIREFEIIGEAVGKLPNEIKQQRTEVEWQDIKDFRNLLIHEYFGVDLARISHRKSAAKLASTMSTSLHRQKHSQHTDSMSASAFANVPRIHGTSQLFATIPVRNAG